MPFCPKCGVDIEAGQVFCEEHREKIVDIKPFDVRLCACGRFFAHNHWFQANDVEESTIKHIRDHIKQKVDVEVTAFDPPAKRGNKGQGSAIIRYDGAEEVVGFPIKLQVCDKCQKLGTHYFTAKLQLRNPPAEVLPYIEEYMAPLYEKGQSINKVEDSPAGPDLYMTHKSTARQLGEKLIRKYGGVMGKSEQHFSRNHMTSKNLYRLNVVVDFPKFKVNDIIILKDRPVIVTGLGKQCTGRDLGLDKKVIFVSGEEEKVLVKKTTSVAMTHPVVSVLDPETFQPAILGNSRAGLEVGDTVTVVKTTKGKVYLAE